jgi:hypothetical protein
MTSNPYLLLCITTEGVGCNTSLAHQGGVELGLGPGLGDPRRGRRCAAAAGRRGADAGADAPRRAVRADGGADAGLKSVREGFS